MYIRCAEKHEAYGCRKEESCDCGLCHVSIRGVYTTHVTEVSFTGGIIKDSTTQNFVLLNEALLSTIFQSATLAAI